MNILVLEDDPDMRSILVQVLEDQGYEVQSAARGEQAVDLARQQVFDLIVADIRMQGMDGLEAVELAKQHQPDLGSLIVSGYASPEETARAERLQVGGYLKKPFGMKEFLGRVRRLLSGRVREEQQQKEEDALREAFFWAVEELTGAAPALAGELVDEMGAELGLAPEVCRQARVGAMLAALPSIRPPSFLSQDARLLPSLSLVLRHWGRTSAQELPILAQVASLAGQAWGRVEGRRFPELGELDPGGLDSSVTGAYHLARKRLLAEPSQEAPPREAADPSRRGRSLLALARALEQTGDHRNAVKAYHEIWQECPGTREAVEALLGHARLLAESDLREALALAHKAPQVARNLGPVASALATLDCGLTLLRMRAPAAVEVLQEAVGSLGRLGLEGARARAQVALAHLGLQSSPDGSADGEVEEAIETLLDPRQAEEVAESVHWLLPSVLEISGRHSSGALRKAVLRMVVDFPAEACRLLQGALLSDPARRALLGSLEESEGYVPEEVLEALAQDPDVGLSAAAARLRSRRQGQVAPPVIRVHTLGTFDAYRGDERVPERDWRTQKVKYLFALLASQWGRGLREDLVLEAFWPGDPAKGKKNLYWSTSILRRCLRGRKGTEGPEFIFRERDCLGLDPELPHWCDVLQLEQADEAAGRAEEAGRRDEALGHLRRMAQVYRGPYMDGCYMDWALERRRRVEETAAEGLCRLAGWCLDRRDYPEALESSRRAVEVQPFRQEAHLLTMRSYLGLGQPEAAIEQFRVCERILRQEYDMEPITELLEYYHRARLGIGDAR